MLKNPTLSASAFARLTKRSQAEKWALDNTLSVKFGKKLMQGQVDHQEPIK